MPYGGPNDPDLPTGVQKLSLQQRKRFVAAFNNVMADCGSGPKCEEKAFKIGYSAAKGQKDMEDEFVIERVGDTIRCVGGCLQRSKVDGKIHYFDYLGFPYEGPMLGGLDLHRTRFTPNTDLGWLGHVMPVYFDHGLFPEIRSTVIGEARIGEETPTGRLVQIAIDEANRYWDFIDELDHMGLLRGSGQAISTLYEIDENSREIVRFHPGEYSLTIRPSNFLAEPARSVFTKHGVSYKGLEKVMESEVQVEETRAMTDEEKKKMEEEMAKKDAGTTRHADEVAAVFKQSEETLRTVDNQAVLDLLRTVETGVQQLTRRLDTLDSEIKDIKTANIENARHYVAAMEQAVTRVRAMSGSEIDVVRSQSEQSVPARTSVSGARLGSPGAYNTRGNGR